MARVSKFQKQFRGFAPVYVCRMCKKNTRETGDGESNVDLCAICYEIAGLENQISDNGPDAAVSARIDFLQALLVKGK